MHNYKKCMACCKENLFWDLGGEKWKEKEKLIDKGIFFCIWKYSTFALNYTDP